MKLKSYTIFVWTIALLGIWFFSSCSDNPTTPDLKSEIQGVLLDEYNMTIPNAIMEVVLPQLSKNVIQSETIIARDTTDEDGRFHLKNIPLENESLELRIIHSDLKSFQEKLSDVLKAKDKSNLQLGLEYQDSCCGKITLTVLSSKDNSAIADVEVRLNNSDGIKRKGKTNSNGELVFNEVCPDDFWLRLAKYGYEVKEIDNVKVNGCDEKDYVEMTVYLTPEERDSCCNGVLTVIPKDKSSNEVLKGVTVKLRKNGAELYKKVNEGDGVKFTDLCKGKYELAILKDGYVGQEISVELDCDENKELDVLLEKRECCDGVIIINTADENKNPIKEAAVRLWKSGVKLGVYYTNADGKIKLTGICEGEYGIDIIKSGYKSIEFSQKVGCNDTIEINKTLYAEEKDSCCDGKIKVIVRDENGNALQYSIVRLWQGGAKKAEAKTNADGYAIFEQICKGDYQISILREGYKSIEFQVGIGCDETLTIEKNLVKDGSKDSCCDGKIKVIVRDENGNPLQYSFVRLWQNGTKKAEIKTDANGYAIFEKLCEGSYGIDIQREGYKGVEFTYTLGCNESKILEKNLSKDGKDSCCQGQIKINVKDEKGNPLQYVLAKLTKSGTVVRDGKTNADGNLTMNELCEGTYYLRLSMDGYKVQEIEVKVGCNEAVSLEKVLVKSSDSCCTAVLKLYFQDENGTAMQGVTVVLYKDGKAIADGTSSTEGWWAEDGLCAPSSYTVLVTKDGYESKEFTFKYDWCTTLKETIKMVKK